MNEFAFPAMQSVGERIRNAPHLLLGLNYNGTLTPIVDHPAKAALSPAMRETLSALARRPDVTLAIVSGRSGTDLLKHIDIPGLIYVGNHGMEIHGPTFQFIDTGALASTETIHEAVERLDHQLKHIDGVLLEDKGLTLSVHYRCVAAIDREEVARTVLTFSEEKMDCVTLTNGDQVYEIRPRLGLHKGTAMEWVADHLDLRDAMMIYMGDDTTDEEAFTTLTDAITIKIGDQPDTAADFLLPTVREAHAFLDWVRELLNEKYRAAPVGARQRSLKRR